MVSDEMYADAQFNFIRLHTRRQEMSTVSDIHLRLAEHYENKREIADALIHARSALKLKPVSARKMVVLSRIFIAIGKLHDAKTKVMGEDGIALASKLISSLEDVKRNYA